MTNEGSRRTSLVAGAADVQASWHRLYDRMLRLEFDGYTGVDPELFPRIMAAVGAKFRAQPQQTAQPFEIFRHLYDEVFVEVDRAYPLRT